MKSRAWLSFAIITTTFWGVWGAFIEIPEKAGFPATLGYVVWALTMIPGAIVTQKLVGWKLDKEKKAVFLGIGAGLLGCGGQLLLFQALRMGPAYIIFPFISLSPVITIILSYWLLKERASPRCWVGIGIAVVAIIMLSYQQPGNSVGKGYFWIILAAFVSLMWGVQAYILKFANEIMRAESLVFYTVCTALALIPFALLMTDFSQTINWGFKGPYLAAMIQFLNAVGFVTLVYAFRFGKAIIVSPMVKILSLLQPYL